MKRKWIRPLFVSAALYDLGLGLLFLFAFPAIFQRFGITLPNHPAYVQFSAALVAVFGLGYWFVAQAPERNRDLIKLGVLMKLAYSVIVLGYWSRNAIPVMWVPLAWIDLAFMAAFLAALRVLPAPQPGGG
jgi:hypothetical protein